MNVENKALDEEKASKDLHRRFTRVALLIKIGFGPLLLSIIWFALALASDNIAKFSGGRYLGMVIFALYVGGMIAMIFGVPSLIWAWVLALRNPWKMPLSCKRVAIGASVIVVPIMLLIMWSTGLWFVMRS